MSKLSDHVLSAAQVRDLEHLLGLEDQRRRCDAPHALSHNARGMLDLLRDLTKVFQHHRVRHALCGPLALAFFARARAFNSLAFVCTADQHDVVVEALCQAGLTPQTSRPDRLTSVDPASGIEVAIVLGTSGPAMSAVVHALAADCLGVAVSLIRPEDLLWTLCRAEQHQDRADALALLKGGHVDVARLRRDLAASDDAQAGQQLSILQLLAKHEADRGDYSASVKRRLAARTAS